jgi:uncharacterized cupin superfamily protein
MCLAGIIMNEQGGVPRIVDFSVERVAEKVSRPSADRLIAGNPEHRAANFFSDATGRMFAGICERTPGCWRVSYVENEFCHITAGEVVIESVDGSRWSFNAGASFVIPAGFRGSWHVKAPLRKLYVIFRTGGLIA